MAVLEHAAATMPLACLAILILGFYRRNGDGRAAVLAGACAWGVVVVGMTEGLGLLGAISFGWLLGAWTVAVACAALFCACARRGGTVGVEPALAGVAGAERGASSRAERGEVTSPMAVDARVHPAGKGAAATETPHEPGKPSIGGFERGLLAAVALVVVGMGLSAFVAPPNSWGGLAYHMSRVMHWMCNHSVAHFPTHYDAEVYQPPLAEFMVLHLQILSGSDHLANGVEWLAMVGSLVGVSLLARELGGNGRAQVLAVVTAATITMGILQGSGTQVNYLLGFWLECAAYFLLAWKPDRAWGCVVGAGVSLGLAALTKGTAYTLGAPLVLWLSLRYLRGAGWRGLGMLVLVGAIAGALNLGHWGRNWRTFGSPLGMTGTNLSVTQSDRGSLAVQAMNARLLASNLLRNISLQLETPSWRMNDWQTRAAITLHRWMGVDVDDPRITFHGDHYRAMKNGAREDRTGDPLHVLVVAGALAVLLWRRRQWAQWGLAARYATAVVGALLVFCACLTWQDSHTRLHLPLLLLAAPLVGVALGTTRRWVGNGVAVLLLVAAMPILLLNRDRPLVGPQSVWRVARVDQYFTTHADLRGPYMEAADLLAERGYRKLGLVCRPHQAEYAMWAAVRDRVGAAAVLRHVGLKAGDMAGCDAIVVLDEEQRGQTLAQAGSGSEQHLFGMVSVVVPGGGGKSHQPTLP